MTWLDIQTMPVAYGGVGLLVDGREVDIYRVSDAVVWDVATGLSVEVVSWRRQIFHTVRQSLAE